MEAHCPYVKHNGRTGVRLSYLLQKSKRGPEPHPQSVLAYSYENYLKRCQREGTFRLRKGLGPGNEALVNYEALSPQVQQDLMKLHGKPYTPQNALEYYYKLSAEVQAWYDAYRFPDGTHLKPEQVQRYTINACVLSAAWRLSQDRYVSRAMRGTSTRGLWGSIVADVLKFRDIQVAKGEAAHTLPGAYDKLKKRIQLFKDHKAGLESLIDKRNRNQAASKVAKAEQRKLLEELIKRPNNMDNAQVAMAYNVVAQRMEWPTLTTQTVANRRKRMDLYTHAGRRGATDFRNTKSMQVKRTPPTKGLTYWTLDGWDVELAYQHRSPNAKGHEVVTYHHRPAVVVVLDRSRGINYPLGYAVDTHETPELIREALRNAVNHTRELFGQRYRTHQLQSDRYGNGALTPFYEGVAIKYTPAAPRNSKAKAVEPYFAQLNRLCQLYYPGNWTGHNVDAAKDGQPNEEYLNKVRHQFPDREGAYRQIATLLEHERSTKREAYIQAFQDLPEADRLPMSTEEYLRLFGHTHTHTCRLHPEGFNPTLLGEQRFYESFDIRFREMAHLDWAVMYDPEDLSEVLVLNATSDGARRLQKVEGRERFLLTARHLQPEALYDRKPGDAEELARIQQYNKDLEQTIIDRQSDNMATIHELFTRPELDGTLAKLLLVDSQGQHKQHLQAERRHHTLPGAPLQPPPPRREPAPPPPDSYEILPEDPRDMY